MEKENCQKTKVGDCHGYYAMPCMNFETVNERKHIN